MKIFRLHDVPIVPASHEDPADPGTLKQVLVGRGDIREGQIQMINWSSVPPDKSTKAHYHETMEEICVMVSGEMSIRVGEEETTIGIGDAVVIPAGSVHRMSNKKKRPAWYLMIGIRIGGDGKTVIVKE